MEYDAILHPTLLIIASRRYDGTKNEIILFNN